MPVTTLPLTVVIGTFGEMVMTLPFGSVVVTEMGVVSLAFGAMLVVLVMEEMVRVLVTMDVLVRLGEMVELDASVGSGEMVVELNPKVGSGVGSGEMVVEFPRVDVSFEAEP